MNRAISTSKSLRYPALLLLLLLIFHWPVVFLGKVYANLWIFRNHAPFPTPNASVLNPLNPGSDLITHINAYKYFAGQCLREGHLPMWDPGVFCGFPLYGNGSYPAFSPLNFLLVWLRPYSAYNIEILLFFGVGALLFYFFLKNNLCVSAPAAFCGTLALVFCPHLMEFIEFDGLLAFVWSFPLVLIVTERASTRSYPLWMALALFVTALFSHMHGVINTLMVAFAYGLAVRSPDVPIKFLKEWAGTMFLFFPLSLFIFYPVFSFFIQSQWQAIPQAFEAKAALNVPVSLYPALVKVPYFENALNWILPWKMAYFTGAPKLGALTFVVSFASLFLLFTKRIPRRVYCFVVLITLYQIVSVITLPGPIGTVAGLFFMKFWQIYIFSSACLLAYSIEVLFESGPFRGAVLFFSRFIFYGILLPVSAVSIYIQFFPEAVKAMLWEAGSAKGLFATGGAYTAARFEEVFGWVHGWFSFRSPFILAPLFVVLALLVVTRKNGVEPATKKKLQWVLAAVLLTELWFLGFSFRPVPVDAASVLPPTQVTGFLDNDKSLFRTMSLQFGGVPSGGVQRYILKPNLGQAYGLYDVGGQDSVLNGKYLFFARKYLSGRPQAEFTRAGILDFEGASLNAASFLNVKYLLASPEASAPAGLERVFEGDGLVLYENKDVLPRLFFTRRFGSFVSEEQSFRRMMDFAPGAEPYVDIDHKYTGVDKAEGLPPEPLITRFEPDDVRARIAVMEPGVLVYTDNWDGGWKVLVDGKPATVLKVNGLFKGVYLEAGAHEVRFYFHADIFFLSLWLSLATAIVILILALRTV